MISDSTPLQAAILDARPDGIPQIQFFGSDILKITKMRKEVNEFLSQLHEEGDIVSDIKYIVSGNCYSVMVFYYVKEKEKENKE